MYRTRDLILAYMNALAAGDVETVVAVEPRRHIVLRTHPSSPRASLREYNEYGCFEEITAARGLSTPKR